MSGRSYFFGTERESIPILYYRIMAFFIRAREAVFRYSKRLEDFDIQPGDSVIDYGCGPGMYVPKAAELVGENGCVCAVDIHPLAVADVEKLVEKRGLDNVKAVLANGYACPLDDNLADVIYMLDAFHMIEEPAIFLKEIYRLLKPTGMLILDDGHQPRQETKQKVATSGIWKITSENDDHIKYIPLEMEIKSWNK